MNEQWTGGMNQRDESRNIYLSLRHKRELKYSNKTVLHWSQ